jgi:hypothetical protein
MGRTLDTYEVYSFSPADRIAGVRCCGHTMTAEAQRFAPRHARVLAGQLSPAPIPFSEGTAGHP